MWDFFCPDSWGLGMQWAPATGLWIILDLSSTGADIGADTSAQAMPVSMLYTRCYATSSSLTPPHLWAGPRPLTRSSPRWHMSEKK